MEKTASSSLDALVKREDLRPVAILVLSLLEKAETFAESESFEVSVESWLEGLDLDAAEDCSSAAIFLLGTLDAFYEAVKGLGDADTLCAGLAASLVLLSAVQRMSDDIGGEIKDSIGEMAACEILRKCQSVPQCAAVSETLSELVVAKTLGTSQLHWIFSQFIPFYPKLEEKWLNKVGTEECLADATYSGVRIPSAIVASDFTPWDQVIALAAAMGAQCSVQFLGEDGRSFVQLAGEEAPLCLDLMMQLCDVDEMEQELQQQEEEKIIEEETAEPLSPVRSPLRSPTRAPIRSKTPPRQQQQQQQKQFASQQAVRAVRDEVNQLRHQLVRASAEFKREIQEVRSEMKTMKTQIGRLLVGFGRLLNVYVGEEEGKTGQPKRVHATKKK